MNLSILPTKSWAPALALLGSTLMGTAATAQVSDLCVNAPLYSYNAVVPFDTNNCIDTGAPATDGGFTTISCGDLWNEVWVRYVPHHTGPVLVSTCNNASYDTRLAVVEDDCIGFLPIACNDNGSAACSGGTSEMQFNAVAGTEYLIMLAGTSSSSQGTGTLFFSALTLPDVPDLCSTPFNLTGLDTDTSDTTTATTSGFNGGGACTNTGSNSVNSDVFWVWRAQESGDYTFDTIGSNFDTKLSLHLGDDCSAPASNTTTTSPARFYKARSWFRG